MFDLFRAATTRAFNVPTQAAAETTHLMRAASRALDRYAKGKAPKKVLAGPAREVEEGVARVAFGAFGGRVVSPKRPETIPVTTAASRAVRAALRVSSQRKTKLSSMGDLNRRVRRQLDKARRKMTLAAAADAQWKIEAYAYAAGRMFKKRGGSLSHPSFPEEAQPIAHFGLGMFALLDAAAFDAEAVERRLDDWVHPQYREFAYDGIGCMLAFSSKSGGRELHYVLEQLGVRSLKPLKDKKRKRFVAAFSQAKRRWLARGCGRGVYFMNASLGSSLRHCKEMGDALDLPRRDLREGVGFAFMMINSPNPSKIRRAHRDVRRKWRCDVRAGIRRALLFNEETFPGLLDPNH